MAQFENFAYYYDRLNENYDADMRVNRLIGLLSGCEEVVDLCCGTGDVAIGLAKFGFQMTGVDISPDMLNVAIGKAKKAAAKVQFVCCDARNLLLPHQVDAIYSLTDGMNYMLGLEELEKAFTSIHNALKRGGQFIFDISTMYKYMNVLSSNAFTFDLEDVFLSWQNDYNRNTKICTMDVVGFVKEAGKPFYRRFDEQHKQYSFTEEEIRGLLQKVGFDIKNVYSDYTTTAVKQNDERILFFTQKR